MGRAARHRAAAEPLGEPAGLCRGQHHPSPRGISQGQGQSQPEMPVSAQVRQGSNAGPSLRQAMLMDPKKKSVLIADLYLLAQREHQVLKPIPLP